MNEDHEKEGEEHQEAGGLTEEQIDALSPGMCVLEECPPQISNWGMPLVDEARQRVKEHPEDMEMLIKGVLSQLAHGMKEDRFGRHAHVFNECASMMVGLAQELAEQGYFEVVQDVFPSFQHAIDAVEPWGSLLNLSRRGKESVHYETVPRTSKMLCSNEAQGILCWREPMLGEVCSQATYEGREDAVATAQQTDPYEGESRHKKYSLDERVHRYFAKRYCAVKQSDEERKPEIIGKFSWHFMMRTQEQVVSAYMPQGYSRGALVKKFVVMLVHGQFWNGGPSHHFSWIDFPPKDDGLFSYLFPPAIRPVFSDLDEWKERIRFFLKYAVKHPKELAVFETMLTLNAAIYAQTGEGDAKKKTLIDDKDPYGWNAVEGELWDALKWYFKVVKRLPRQNIATFP